MNIIIAVLTVLCVVGAFGAIVFAATASSRADAALRRLKNRQSNSQESAKPLQMSEPESAKALIPAAPEEEIDRERESFCVSNVPHIRNSRFYGRDKLISEIRSALVSQNRVSLVDSAQGTGGVGKTSAVAEYVRRYTKEYKLIWWIRASDSAMISADYASLAAKLDLRFEDAGPDVVREAVCNALGNLTDWLLIFDDAVNPELVRSYIPSPNYS